MHKKPSVLLIALLMSTGLAVAAENDGAGLIGPDPTAVTGASSSGAANSGTQGDNSAAYIDCPGNAFSGGIRNDPKGRDCVPPESLVIQGDDNLTRDSMTEDLSQGVGSSVSATTGTSNSGTGSSSSQADNVGGSTSGAANRSGGTAGTTNRVTEGQSAGSSGTTGEAR